MPKQKLVKVGQKLVSCRCRCQLVKKLARKVCQWVVRVYHPRADILASDFAGVTGETLATGSESGGAGVRAGAGKPTRHLERAVADVTRSGQARAGNED